MIQPGLNSWRHESLVFILMALGNERDPRSFAGLSILSRLINGFSSCGVDSAWVRFVVVHVWL